MPLDANILLQGRSPDIAGNIPTGLKIGRALQEQPIRNQLLDQSLLQGTQDLAAGDEALLLAEQKRKQLEANEFQQRQVLGARQAVLAWSRKDIGGVIEGIKNGFHGDQEAINAELAEFHTDPKQYMLQTQDEITAFDAQQTSGRGSATQFGAQSTFKDSKSNLFFGTTARDPNTGEVRSVLAAIDGSDRQPVGAISQTGAFGQTAAESTGKKITEASGTTGAKLDVELEKKPLIEGAIVKSVGEAEVKTPLGEIKLALDAIKLDETRAKTNQGRQDIINAKTVRRDEALNAASVIDSLLNGDRFTSAYGKLVANTPDLLKSQESIDAIADVERVVGLLSLESRQKLKGQGTITDSEAKTLEKSATILANPLISDNAARKELSRVRVVFSDAASRNQLKKETLVKKAESTEVDQELLQFMTPEERALF